MKQINYVLRFFKEDFFTIPGDMGMAGEDFRRENFLNSFVLFLIGNLMLLLAAALAKYHFGFFIFAIITPLFFAFNLRGILGIFFELPGFIDSLMPYQIIGLGPVFMIDGWTPKGKKPHWFKGFIFKEKAVNYLASNENRMKLLETKPDKWQTLFLVYDNDAE
jgi:hypothetical protein